MSTQRGNVSRNRPQKHKNTHVFKNDLHDTNIRTKRVNSTQIVNICEKCKNILEWKIKYKKYKVIKAAKTCNKCLEKCVKMPYHTVCRNCSRAHSICPKCGVKVDNSVVDTTEPPSDIKDEKMVVERLKTLRCDSDDNNREENDSFSDTDDELENNN